MKPSLTPILLFLLLLYLAGMLRVWVWAIGQIIGRRPLSLPRFTPKSTRAPWGIGTIILVLVVYIGVNLGVVQAYDWITGQTKQSAKEPQADQAAGQKESRQKSSSAAKIPETPKVPDQAKAGADSPAPPRLSVTEKMFLLTVINEILIVLIPILVRLTSGARLIDLGLSLIDWRRQIKIGMATALLVAPVVFLIQYLAIQVWTSNKHPVEDMIRKEFTPGIAYLAVVSAVIMAPVVEELVFRGIIQSWLVKLASLRSRVAEAPAEQLAGLGPDEASELDNEPETDSLGRPARQAILTTSFIFASVHFEQWPAPIPIFLLSATLGVVYHRTGSLLTSIATHATFNSLSTLLLFLAMTADPKSLPDKAPVPQPAKIGVPNRPLFCEQVSPHKANAGLVINP